MAGRSVRLAVLLAVTAAAGAASGDEFDRIEGEALQRAATGEGLAALDQQALARLPRVLAGVRSTVLVARTDEGNLARLLVSVARRVSKSGSEAPVLVVERYATFASPGFRQRLAMGRELMLFDGGRLDLDSGQVVPEGFGEDLRLSAAGDGALTLHAEGGAALFGLSASPLEGREETGRPSSGRAVLPGDHAGRYRLIVGGRWSGALEIAVDPKGAVSGSFRSDQTGAVYRARGDVARGGTPRLDLSIDFPRSRMTLAGHLWPDGKDAIAGTARLMDQDYGFVAVREGRTVEPPGLDLDGGSGEPCEITLRLAADGTLTRNGAKVEVAALAAEAGPDAEPSVRVLADPTTSLAVVERVLTELRAAGLDDLRLAVAEGQADE